MGSAPSALVWLAGDVTQYETVRYVLRIGGDVREYRTFISVAALAEGINPGKLVALVPETLFEGEQHCELYRLLLKAKSGFGRYRLVSRGMDATDSDELVHRLLERGFDCYVVPHPGIASPLRLRVEDGAVHVERGDAKEFPGYSFNLVFSTVYLVLSRYARSFSTIHIDVTHGTNVLVSAALLAAPLLHIAYGTEVRIYAAPVMGRPGGDTRVEFLVLDEALGAVEEVAAGGRAWDMVDERLLPIDYYSGLGPKLGRLYRRVYSSVKSVLETSRDLLWGLRSGQLPILLPIVDRLAKGLDEAWGSFNEIVSRELPLDGKPHSTEWSRHAQEPPWPPVASITLSLTRRLVDQLRSDRNICFVLKALRMLLDKGYPDKVLSVGREWLVALYLWRRGKRGLVGVGKEEWEYAGCALRLEPVFEKARQYRNKLMHGRLSVEDNMFLELLENDVLVGRRGGKEGVEVPKPIGAGELRNVASELLRLIEDLSGRCEESGAHPPREEGRDQGLAGEDSLHR